MTVTVERTRVSAGNQVVVPSGIRKQFGVKTGDDVIWAVVGGEVHVRFLKKRKNALSGLVGRLDMGRTGPETIDEVVSSG